MDRIELYIDGFKFADAMANRDHTIRFNGRKFKSAAEMYEVLVDILEPDLDDQLLSLREKLRNEQYFYFYEQDY